MSDEQILEAIKDLAIAFTNDGDAILAINEDDLRRITIAQFRKLFNL